MIGERTRPRLPDSAIVEALPPLQLKGKAEPVIAHVFVALPD